MAIPVFRTTVSSGATDAGGAWSYTTASPAAAGRVIIAQILQDGNTDGALTSIVGTNIENLAGTDNVWTQITGANADGSHPVGDPAAARQFLYIGRSLSTTAATISGGNSTSEDLYIRAAEFSDVNTGTALSDVIENASAGAFVNGVGTGTSMSDADVTTLGADRLALNFRAANDDVTWTVYSGESGGTWQNSLAYSDAAGTDGAIALERADMVSAGTIGGATATVSPSASWGVVGFALIGTTPAGPATSMIYQPGLQAAIPRSLYTR